VIRLTELGALDTTFGDAGVVVLALPPGALADPRYNELPVAVQPDGRLVVALVYLVGPPEARSRFAVTRLEPDGDVDPSFGDGGRTPVLGGSIAATVLEPNGRLVAVGGSEDFYSGHPDAGAVPTLMARLLVTGTCGDGGDCCSVVCEHAALGGACDTPCPGGTSLATGAQLTLTRIAPPAGDDRLTLKGTVTLPLTPSLDPVSKGMSLLIADATGAVVVNRTLPPGLYDGVTRRGWRVSGGGLVFRYLDKANGGDVTRVDLKPRGPVPGSFSVAVSGSAGRFAVAPGTEPVRALLVLDPPSATTGQCAELAFPGPPPAPACTFSAAGSTLRCR
jgi:hypothetical protein